MGLGSPPLQWRCSSLSRIEGPTRLRIAQKRRAQLRRSKPVRSWESYVGEPIFGGAVFLSPLFNETIERGSV